MITVITHRVKICASNAQMKAAARFVPGMAAHARYANARGTSALPVDNDEAGRGGRRGPRQLIAVKNDAPPGLKIDVRQGIARARGHVAPARSLC